MLQPMVVIKSISLKNSLRITSLFIDNVEINLNLGKNCVPKLSEEKESLNI